MLLRKMKVIIIYQEWVRKNGLALAGVMIGVSSIISTVSISAQTITTVETLVHLWLEEVNKI